MTFSRGDLVQVVNEKSAYHGQVGAIVKGCGCLFAVVVALRFCEATYQVGIDGGKCFRQGELRKLGGRPERVSEPQGREVEKPVGVGA